MLRHCDLSDLSRTAVTQESNRSCNRRVMCIQTPFGLTTVVNSHKLYVTDWDKNAMFEVDVTANPASVRKIISGVSLPMAVQYTSVSGVFYSPSRSPSYTYSQQF